jgi:hypothetical protein
MDVVSVPARHDAWAVYGPRPRHAVPARTRHENRGNTTKHDYNLAQPKVPTQQQPTPEKLAVGAHRGLLTAQRPAAAVYKPRRGALGTNPSSFPPSLRRSPPDRLVVSAAAACLVVSAAVPPPHLFQIPSPPSSPALQQSSSSIFLRRRSLLRRLRRGAAAPPLPGPLPSLFSGAADGRQPGAARPHISLIISSSPPLLLVGAADLAGIAALSFFSFP